MRLINFTLSNLIFISLCLLSACDQQTNTSSSPRISFELNVYDKQFGKYHIHVNALTTDQLPAEIARGYNISRSKNRAMINISIREKTADGEKPIVANVNVIAKNLNNQLKNIKLREIKETDPAAIYYIGELPVNHKETIIFDLDVMPEGISQPLLLSYRQQFFTE